MAEQVVRVGFVGCGQWGPNHIRNLAALEGCRVVRAADLSPERREAVRRQFPAIEVTDDAQRVIEADDLDAVVVSTPTRTHYALAKAALLADKHVLCEKPLTVLPAESEELIRIAAQRQRTLMVGHVFVFNSGINDLKQRLDRGDVGGVQYLDAVRTNLGPIRSDVSAVWDLASHDVSIFDYLLGANALGVSASGARILGNEREDVAFLTFDYPNGVVCHVHVSWLNPRKVRQLTLVGTKRMLVWDDIETLEPVRIYDKGLEGQPYYDDFGHFRHVLRDGDITIPKVRMHEPLRQQAAHFLHCVRTGSVPAASGAHGLSVVRALDGAERSLREGGRRVEIARS